MKINVVAAIMIMSITAIVANTANRMLQSQSSDSTVDTG